jgi:hypothetical protein
MTGKTTSHADQKLSQEKRSQERSHERIQDQGRCEQTNLEVRYGEIGISAVAAAVRYADVTKKPADALAAPRVDQRFVEFAA